MPFGRGPYGSAPYSSFNLHAPPLDERYTKMQARIAELESALAEIPTPSAPSIGMGHNNPPEEIEPSDIAEIRDAVQVLKVQRLSPPDKGAEALQAVKRIEAKASKLQQWVERHAEEFTSEAAKAAGKQTGTWITRGFILWLIDQMLGLSNLVHIWINAL